MADKGWTLFEFTYGERPQHPGPWFWNTPCTKPDLYANNNRDVLLELPYLIVLRFKLAPNHIQVYVDKARVP